MPMVEVIYCLLKYAQKIGKGWKCASQKFCGEVNEDREVLRLINTFKNYSFLTTPVVIY